MVHMWRWCSVADEPSLWSVAGPGVCELECGDNAECSCNIDMGYHTCVCKPGFYRDGDTCTGQALSHMALLLGLGLV